MRKFKTIMTIIILILSALLLYHVLDHYFPSNIISRILTGFSLVLTPVLIALILSYLLNPFTDMLIKRFKFKKELAVGLTILLLILFTAALILFTVFFLIDQSKSFIDTISRP